MRVRLTSFFFLLFIVMAWGGNLDGADRSGGATAALPLDIWTVDSLTRVQPDEQPSPGSSEAQLKAARNEFEAVQVILRSHAPLRAVSATVTDLAGASFLVRMLLAGKEPVAMHALSRPDLEDVTGSL